MPTRPVTPPASSTGTVSALERGIAVLRCFNESAATLSNAELSERTGIPKPTVSRLATTLVSLGLLRQDAITERFALTAGVVSLARAFLAHLDVREVARPYMQALAQHLGGATYLAVRDGCEMVLIEIARSREVALRSHHEVGTRIPLIVSALGRAFLAGLAQRQPQRYGQVLKQLEQACSQASWPTTLQQLQSHQDTWQREGYALSLGEVNQEIHSIAVPLSMADGEPMALNFGGPAFTFTEAWMRERVAPELQRVAQAIAQEIGDG